MAEMIPKNPDEAPLSQEELDFLNLVLMLGNTASVELGEKTAKGEGPKKNLPRARQFVNMLSVIEKKTQGRRSRQEEEVLRKLLADLQEKYVKAAGLEGGQGTAEEMARVAMQSARNVASAYAQTKKPPKS
jgi:hypothetical protein